jgi:glycolate oxidase iron-sulfur subunit
MQTARMLALKNVKAFLNAGVDIITSADATCGGSFVHEYRLLLNDDPGYLEFAQKYREIHKLILELGLPEKLKRKSEKISYHDSCHLRHTQGIAEEPRKILKSLPGLELPEMAEADICCGFGGSFSVFHAPDSSEISGKKLENALAVGADGIACGSPGCILKLREEVVRRRLPLKVKHTVEFIRERLEID